MKALRLSTKYQIVAPHVFPMANVNFSDRSTEKEEFKLGHNYCVSECGHEFHFHNGKLIDNEIVTADMLYDGEEMKLQEELYEKADKL